MKIPNYEFDENDADRLILSFHERLAQEERQEIVEILSREEEKYLKRAPSLEKGEKEQDRGR